MYIKFCRIFTKETPEILKSETDSVVKKFLNVHFSIRCMTYLDTDISKRNELN